MRRPESIPRSHTDGRRHPARRSRRELRLLLLITGGLVAVFLLALPVGSGDAPAPPPAGSPTGPPTAQPAEEEPDERLEEFEPSEDVSADSAISFPVDI